MRATTAFDQIRQPLVDGPSSLDWPGPPGVGGTSLHAAGGRPTDRLELLDSLLVALEPRRVALDTEAGRQGLQGDLRARCSTLGRSVRVELADRIVVGTAVDVTASGHLCVETGRGVTEVAAGDVIHLRPGGPETKIEAEGQ